MKNPLFALLPPFSLGVFVMAAAACLAAPVSAMAHWSLSIVAAVALCLGAAVCHYLSKGRRGWYLAGYLLNALGSGVAVAALYAQMGWNVEILSVLSAVVPAALVGTVFCLGYVGQKALWRKIWGLSMVLLAVALLVLAVIAWIRWESVMGSMAFFSGICLLFFMVCALCVLEEPARKWRYLSFSGFWAFAVIGVVVVLILSEGELLDGLDLDFGGGKGRKNRKK